MKAFLALLGMNFKSLLLTSTNLGTRKKKRAASGVGALALICFLMVYLSGVYSFLMASALGPLGALDVMLMIMIIMATFFPLLIVLFAGQGLLFSTKDLDLVLSLPVSSFSVMLARLLALYLEALMMVELMLIPTGIAYLIYGGSGGVLFMVLLLVMGVFLALLPTLICLVFGTVISLLVSRMRHKNLFNILFSLLFVGLILVGSMSLGGGAATIATNIEGLRASLSSIAPLNWVVQGLVRPNVLYLLLVAALCAVPFFALAWLFSLFYKRLLTALSSHAMRQNYKLQNVRGGSAGKALLKKEAGKFFGTPAFVLNNGVGIIIVLGASIFAAIKKSSINELVAVFLNIDGGEVITELIPPILLLAVVFMLSTAYIAAVSISLEGKTLWILKEAPISTGRIFAAKAGFNFLISGGATLLTMPILGYAFSILVADVVGMLLVGLLVSAFTSASGLYINLLFPRMDAENDTVVIKQSASAITCMLATWVLLLLGAGVYFLITVLAGLSFFIYCLIMSVITGGLLALAIALLNTKGRRLFANL